MKFRWDRKYLHWGVTAFCVIAASILFYLLLTRIPTIRGIFSTVADILQPILYGVVIAYLLWPLVRLFEKKVTAPLGGRFFRKKPERVGGFARATAILLVLVLLLGLIAGLLVLILPQLGESIHHLISSMPQYVSASIEWLQGLFDDNPTMQQYVAQAISSVTDYVVGWAENSLLPAANNLLTSISSSAVDIVTTLFNVLIGLVAAVYLLFSKETFLAQSKKLLFAAVSPKRGNRILHHMRFANDMFSRTIVGRLFEALLVGLLCFVLMLIFRIPYAGLISVIVGITDIIPFFGPFIGAVPSAFLILLVDPIKMLIFVALILVIQQIEGNILGPKILGNLTGLPSFWVMFSTLAMGGLFGVGGMVLGVPVFAILRAVLQHFSRKHLARKGLPTDTAAYQSEQDIVPAENGD